MEIYPLLKIQILTRVGFLIKPVVYVPKQEVFKGEKYLDAPECES
jgi:hypothetical protein